MCNKNKFMRILSCSKQAPSRSSHNAVLAGSSWSERATQATVPDKGFVCLEKFPVSLTTCPFSCCGWYTRPVISLCVYLRGVAPFFVVVCHLHRLSLFLLYGCYWSSLWHNVQPFQPVITARTSCTRQVKCRGKTEPAHNCQWNNTVCSCLCFHCPLLSVSYNYFEKLQVRMILERLEWIWALRIRN